MPTRVPAREGDQRYHLTKPRVRVPPFMYCLIVILGGGDASPVDVSPHKRIRTTGYPGGAFF